MKKHDLFENTLIFFASDNGASGEGASYSRDVPEGRLLGDRGSYGRIDGIGANAFNTPFIAGKSTLWQGGIGTPMIAHWPDDPPNLPLGRDSRM